MFLFSAFRPMFTSCENLHLAPLEHVPCLKNAHNTDFGSAPARELKENIACCSDILKKKQRINKPLRFKPLESFCSTGLNRRLSSSAAFFFASFLASAFCFSKSIICNNMLHEFSKLPEQKVRICQLCLTTEITCAFLNTRTGKMNSTCLAGFHIALHCLLLHMLDKLLLLRPFFVFQAERLVLK